MLSSVFLAADDDGDVLGDVGKRVQGGLQLGALLAAGQVAQHRLILHLEIFDLDVRFWHHGRN